MSINDRFLTKQIVLISAKFLLYGVNVVQFSNDHSVLAASFADAITHFVVFNCEFVTFPNPGQVWYLIVSIPDLYTLTYFSYDIPGPLSSNF